MPLMDIPTAVQAYPTTSLRQAINQGLSNSNDLYQQALKNYMTKVQGQYAVPNTLSSLANTQADTGYRNMQTQLAPQQLALERYKASLQAQGLGQGNMNSQINRIQLLKGPNGVFAYDKITGNVKPVPLPQAEAIEASQGVQDTGMTPPTKNALANPFSEVTGNTMPSASSLQLLTKLHPGQSFDMNTGKWNSTITPTQKTALQKSDLAAQKVKPLIDDYIKESLATSGPMNNLAINLNQAASGGFGNPILKNLVPQSDLAAHRNQALSDLTGTIENILSASQFRTTDQTSQWVHNLAEIPLNATKEQIIAKGKYIHYLVDHPAELARKALDAGVVLPPEQNTTSIAESQGDEALSTNRVPKENNETKDLSREEKIAKLKALGY